MAELQEEMHRGIVHVYETVVGAALEEVGRLWAEDQITVADEHLATATAQSAIASIYRDFPWPPPEGPKVVIACVEGERHEIGARMVADLLALDGWQDMFLGADTPLRALLDKVIDTKPVLVGLSITLTSHLGAVREAVSSLRRELPDMKVLLGGRALGASEEPEPFGADGVCFSASGAVNVARAWRYRV